MHAILLAALLTAPSADSRPGESQAAATLLGFINRERRANGEEPLAVDTCLNQAAVDHVEDMAERNYFDHDSPDGVSPWDRMHSYGCAFSFAGENIARAGDAAQAARALFASAPHRANILNGKFTRVGIAVMYSNDGRLLIVEDFAG